MKVGKHVEFGSALDALSTAGIGDMAVVTVLKKGDRVREYIGTITGTSENQSGYSDPDSDIAGVDIAEIQQTWIILGTTDILIDWNAGDRGMISKIEASA